MEFEKALNRLEEIKTQLENPEITLDESIKLYSESVDHAKKCIEKLTETEGKFSIIKTEFDKIVEKPLEPSEE